jgi:hypothetical protein
MKDFLGFALFGLLFVASSQAAVKCQIREGSGCGGPVIYEMQLCAVVTFNQGTCIDHCRDLKPICNVDAFDRWVGKYKLWGRNGIHGSLLSQSENYDEDGTLEITAEKNYTVCMRTKTSPTGSYGSPSVASGTISCPSLKMASAETCASGTVFNPTSGLCEVQDPSCGPTNAGPMNELIKQGQMFVTTQNDHFSTNSKIDPRQFATTANPVIVSGLQQPTVAGNPAIPDTNAAAASLNPNRRSGGRSANSAASGNGSTGNSVGFSAGSSATGSGSPNDLAKRGEASMLASAYLEKEEGGARLGGGADGDSAANGKGSSGLSWFGSGSSTPGGSAGEVGFDKDGKGAAGADGKGASRGLASVSDSDLLKVEDPADYFMKSDIDTSLFKRVTSQCRKKEKDLVLAP